MRVKTDEEYEKMSRISIINYLKRINEMQEVDQDEETNNLKIRLKKFERKRHFMWWHDTSTISNHSHVLMTISTLFDPAIHYTSEEYQQKYNKTIQAVVEAPIWYIFGRCSATDETLVYSEQRLNDIIQMKDPIKNSEIEIYDEMRFFKGDGPSAQFEAGQQKEGNYVCWICDINVVEHSNYSCLLNRACINLQDRQDKVLFTEQSRKKSHDKIKKLYSYLTKKEIIVELNQQNVNFTKNESKQLLDLKLTKTMHGIQRVPSLIFYQPDISLPKNGLSKYELLMEPLHDVFNHIKNLLRELPHHFDKKAKTEIESIIELSFEGKDVKRAVDYRSCIIKTSIYFQQKFP
nr:uncharacterized protein LOC124814672 [Hydra vulgaris]